MAKIISPDVIMALKSALTTAFWYKSDLHDFLIYSLGNKPIFNGVNWEDIKYDIVSYIINSMIEQEEVYQKDILKLCKDVCAISNYHQLERSDDPEKRISEAKKSIKSLAAIMRKHTDICDTLAQRQKSKSHYLANVSKIDDHNKKLLEFKNEFDKILKLSSPQKRGFKLEKFLNELFVFFDLDAAGSFKISGEQIDGAFTHDGTDYIIEAKWQDKYVNKGTLLEFAGKVEEKLKTTLGLFISINGFSSEALEIFSPQYRSIILMDGMDLILVLEGRISLRDLIYKKRRHASETGEILYRPIGL